MTTKKALPKGLKLHKGTQGETIAQLYNTIIVRQLGASYQLNTGSWYTMHTKKCMNLLLNQFDIKVSQKAGQWLVTQGNKTIPFVDGMIVTP